MNENKISLNETLEQRKLIYGDYKKACISRVKILKILKEHHLFVNKKHMDEELTIGFSDLVLKLVRASATPQYSDSFHDLAGYAQLLEKEAKEFNNE